MYTNRCKEKNLVVTEFIRGTSKQSVLVKLVLKEVVTNFWGLQQTTENVKISILSLKMLRIVSGCKC